MTTWRETQEAVEVVTEVTGADLHRRQTQEAVEVVTEVTGADLHRRLTQIAIEVLITLPVHPFGEMPMPEYPQWSPAYFQPPEENQEQNFASLFGVHGREMRLGDRGCRVEFRRK